MRFTNIKQKYLIYISIQTLCNETRNWTPLHLVCINHSWDVTTTWSPPVVNSIDWTWFGKAHTCLFIGPTVDSACQSKNQAMRLKELSVDLRDRIVSRHRSGEGYQNISAALKVPKNTVASIILKRKKFGTTKTLPRAGARPNQIARSQL